MNLIRPNFPKRAVITAGMPYGNKELHFGHVGGVFIHADMLARFLRDRLGKDNVIFVSGTDCYGSPIVESFRQLKENGEFEGSIQDFVQKNHDIQKEALDNYDIDIDIYAASSIGKAAEIHKETSKEIFEKLYSNGYIKKMTTSQFYDTERETLLNGRQVIGRCPIEGCQSDKGYADECALGHQYMPTDLISPKSTLSGTKPIIKEVTNWYFKLDEFNKYLSDWIKVLEEKNESRRFLVKTLKEFLKLPELYIKNDQIELLEEVKELLPKYTLGETNKKSSVILIFEKLEDREKACKILAEKDIRFRTGKTLVPFRLTGNIEWGVDVPVLEGAEDLTFWVWPESLWAPISFTKTYLDKIGKAEEEWKDWWCSKDSKVYQFIGEDNIYFYGLAEMAMFMALQGNEIKVEPDEKELQLPHLIPNNHVLFLDKKASSSGKIKPPMANDLLNYYTNEQLRGHFLSLGLGIRSVSFQPKPLNPKAPEKSGDPVLREGNLLTNVFNRVARSCFYTIQKYYDCKIPVGNVSDAVLETAKEAIITYENFMFKQEFHKITDLVDVYVRNTNKYFSKFIKQADSEENTDLHKQTVIDAFYMIRVASLLVHPIAPKGTEMIVDYLNIDKSEFFSWDNVFSTLNDLIDNPETHSIKFLEPKVDFFTKHETQLVF